MMMLRLLANTARSGLPKETPDGTATGLRAKHTDAATTAPLAAAIPALLHHLFIRLREAGRAALLAVLVVLMVAAQATFVAGPASAQTLSLSEWESVYRMFAP